MKRIYLQIVILAFILIVSACQDKKRDAIVHLVEQWQGKEVLFPDSCIFTILAKDTVQIDVHSPNYKVLMYVDSTGCTSCRLQLHEWKKFMAQIDSLTDKQTQFLFFLSPKSIRDARYTLRKEDFIHPLCIDMKDELNRLNQFPSQDSFQTFLLNKDNKIAVMGNPIHNRKVRLLYIKELTGKQEQKYIKANIETSNREINLGTLTINEEKSVSFTLRNIGSQPLVIHDVVTSCGCIQAAYDKALVHPNKETEIKVVYKADETGSFNKTIKVYCNTPDFPLKFKIKGKVIN